MKTKNKVVALLEIAVVLCSVFLVAVPTIAAEQNKTTHEVSASVVTPASEDEYVLDIYGNANEDYTIDMRDVTYTKLVIFGKKPETELADAYYDDEVDVLDVVQIKLIILGRESELTVVDSTDRIVTVKKPVERIVTATTTVTEVTRMLGAKDRVVGVTKYVVAKPTYFPELSKLPSVGGWGPDAEMILSLNPDLVTTWEHDITTWHLDEKLPGIPVVAFKFRVPAEMKEEIMKLGYILGKKDRAEEFFDDFYDKYIDLIGARTEGLSEEKKPKVYLETWYTYQAAGGDSFFQQIIDIAGGRNIFADVEEDTFDVEAEEVAWRNPDIIIKYATKGVGGVENSGYDSDDSSDFQALRESIMNRPGLARVSAVENERIYIIEAYLIGGLTQPMGVTYFAKWLQPELFEDLDPQAIHQEFIDNFCPGLDFDVSEHGVFVYPPLE